ncbi:ATP-binding protein [Endothiovibrio diazotrophicus]
MTPTAHRPPTNPADEPLAPLLRLGRLLTAQRPDTSLYQELLEYLLDTFGAASGSLTIADNEAEIFTFLAVVGLPRELLGTMIPADHGILGWVARSGRPLLLDGDADDHPELAALPRDIRAHRPHSAICWPLRVGSEVIGLVSLNRPPGVPPFTRETLDHGSDLMSLVTVLIENIRLHIRSTAYLGQVREEGRRQVILAEARAWAYEAQESLGEREGWRHFEQQSLFHACKLVGAEAGRLLLFDDGETPPREETVDAGNNAGLLSRLPRSREFARRLLSREGAPMVISDPAAHPLIAPLLPPGAAAPPLLAAPIPHPQGATGILYLGGARGGTFGVEDEVAIHLFALDLGRALERHALVKRLSETNHQLEREKGRHLAVIERLSTTHNRLVEAEKMASVGQLAAGLAHELNTPLGYLRSNLESLKRYCDLLLARATFDAAADDELDYAKEDLPSLLEESRDGLERMHRIVGGLRDFSRVDDEGEHWEAVDLRHELEGVIALIAPQFPAGVRIERRYGTAPPVPAMAARIHQAFMAIIINAVQAMGEKGVLTFSSGEDPGGGAWVAIADDGPGIPAEHLGRIFEPFYTTKPVGTGTGLGLSLAYGVIHHHHGTVDVASETGRGTTFTLHLPAHAANEAQR